MAISCWYSSNLHTWSVEIWDLTARQTWTVSELWPKIDLVSRSFIIKSISITNVPQTNLLKISLVNVKVKATKIIVAYNYKFLQRVESNKTEGHKNKFIKLRINKIIMWKWIKTRMTPHHQFKIERIRQQRVSDMASWKCKR